MGIVTVHGTPPSLRGKTVADEGVARFTLTGAGEGREALPRVPRGGNFGLDGGDFRYDGAWPSRWYGERFP